MNLRLLSFLFSILIITSFGCGKDDDVVEPDPPGKFDTGFFITNEGPFGEGTGTISFYNTVDNTITQDIYQAENNNAVLGNIVQSMGSTSSHNYIVVNNANTVVVVDKTEFKRSTTIEGFELPRYFVADTDGTTGYVSQWGADGMTGSVAMVDLSTNTITGTVPTGMGAEKMFLTDEKLYVVNAGGFGSDNQVSVINIADKTIEKQIEVGDNPNSIQRDKTGAIWVLTGGILNWTDPALSTEGVLAKLVNDEVVSSFAVPTSTKNLQIDAAGEFLYYTTSAGIVKFSIEDDIPPSVIATASCYAFGMDTTNATLYCSDAKDFASNGEVTAYDTNGNSLFSFETGIIPGSFSFD